MLGHQADEREYSAAAAIIEDLGILSIRLMTNNPAKIDHLEQLGVSILELPLFSTVTQDNAAYLTTKIQRMRHPLAMPVYTNGHHHDLHGNHESHPYEAHATDHSDIQHRVAALRAHHHHAQYGVPFVTLSYAQTLDGTIGSRRGWPLRISGAIP